MRLLLFALALIVSGSMSAQTLVECQKKLVESGFSYTPEDNSLFEMMGYGISGEFPTHRYSSNIKNLTNAGWREYGSLRADDNSITYKRSGCNIRIYMPFMSNVYKVQISN